MYKEKIESLLYRMNRNNLHCTSLKFNSMDGIVLFMREIKPYKEVIAKQDGLNIKLTKNHGKWMKKTE